MIKQLRKHQDVKYQTENTPRCRDSKCDHVTEGSNSILVSDHAKVIGEMCTQLLGVKSGEDYREIYIFLIYALFEF